MDFFLTFLIFCLIVAIIAPIAVNKRKRDGENSQNFWNVTAINLMIEKMCEVITDLDGPVVEKLRNQTAHVRVTCLHNKVQIQFRSQSDDTEIWHIEKMDLYYWEHDIDNLNIKQQEALKNALMAELMKTPWIQPISMGSIDMRLERTKERTAKPTHY